MHKEVTMTKQAKPVMLDKDGYLTINPDGIQLPAASADTAGVVKVGPSGW